MTPKAVVHPERAFVAVMLIGASLILSACGGTKASIAKALNEELAKEQVCYSHGSMGNAPRWPLRVRREILSSGELHPVLSAMQAAGQVKVTQTEVQNGWITETADVITPTDEAKKWWNKDTGWCVGTKAIASVTEWTPPEGSELQVSYTWKLVDVPSWAKHTAFDDLPGMSKPAEDEAVVQQTNNGWKAVF